MAHLPRFIRKTVLVAFCCWSTLMLTAPTALAHDSLKSSFPARDAEVSSVERIELVFSARVMFPAVALREASGAPVAIGRSQADGSKVISKVTGAIAPGEYVIAWRVVSSDGHPVEGEIPFTVTGSAAPSAPATRGGPTASLSPAPVAAGPATTGGQGSSPEVPGWIWGGLVALVILGAVVWSRTSRRNAPDSTDSTDSTG
ncbi:copper resistance CopC family protein [Streptosporangium sp. CA-135522]|uniref:copper resistance CopC family protein n=1 Tax=Streptosporangium sp. CA-135522 TaxID=3240072 RepID=UPI003D8D7B9B